MAVSHGGTRQIIEQVLEWCDSGLFDGVLIQAGIVDMLHFGEIVTVGCVIYSGVGAVVRVRTLENRTHDGVVLIRQLGEGSDGGLVRAGEMLGFPTTTYIGGEVFAGIYVSVVGCQALVDDAGKFGAGGSGAHI